MCGIIGYLGSRSAGPILIDGLRAQEYRGYDSAGIMVYDPASGATARTRSDGKVDDLVAKLGGAYPVGTAGLGHTRWATHGRVSIENAHPHTDCDGRIFVVHNGIIENFAELREELAAAGHEFVTETDTEVVAHLIEERLKDPTSGDYPTAVRLALQRLRGDYALVIFHCDHPDVLIGARLHAPLVIGLGRGENFVASDPAALIPYTKTQVMLGEGELAVVDVAGVSVTSFDGIKIEPRVLHVDWDVSEAQKGGFAHYMLKEIHEDALAASNAVRGRIDERGRVRLEGLKLDSARLAAIEEVVFLGMGTALHACQLGEYLVEDLAGLRARSMDASEFRYRRVPVGPRTLAVVVTQSGETADTLAGMRQAAAGGAHTVAVTNVVGSTVTRDADSILYLHAGPEVAVASTKTFVSQVLVVALVAIRLAQARGTIGPELSEQLAASFLRLPSRVADLVERREEIKRLARRYRRFTDFMFIGRELNHPVAMEGALKLKEISYLHAEAQRASDLKHGPIALLDQNFPVVAICTQSPTRDKMLSTVQQVVARDAPVIALVTEGDTGFDAITTDLFSIPVDTPVASAVLASVALQLFSYYMAVELGRDVDQPRNLAKSVTVE